MRAGNHLAFLLALATATAAVAADPAISVIDGDTLEIDGRIIQVAGIDAPELGQTCQNDGSWWDCGIAAAFALKKRIEFDRPHCSVPEAQGAATCITGGASLAVVLLREGYVEALPDASAAFHEAEQAARAASLGLWRGRFVAPSEWRAGRRLQDERAEAPACPVKAVSFADGSRRYLVPTDAAYGEVKAERCFASDEAARDTGLRRPPQTAPR